MLTMKWKVYIYNTTSSATTSNYTVSFSNNKTTKNYNYTANISIACSSMAIVNKNVLTVSGVVLSSNLITFSSINAKIGIS